MRINILSLLVLITVGNAGVALAADGEAVFKQQCASCHGVKGQGMQYVAPRLKGSEFVTTAAVDEIKATITAGRAGDEKRHADFPAAMPPFPQLSEAEVAAVVEYIRTGLQE